MTSILAQIALLLGTLALFVLVAVLLAHGLTKRIWRELEDEKSEP